LTIQKYDTDNALAFIIYASIYHNGEVKRMIYHLYRGVIFILGLEVDKEPAGFLVVERRDEAHYVCTTLYIQPNARNKGLEKVLLERALDETKDEGASHFYISYFINHEDADFLKELYQGLGFTPSGYERHTFVMKREEIGEAINQIAIKYNRYLNSYRTKTKTFRQLEPEIFKRVFSQKGNEIPRNFYPFTQGYSSEYSAMICRDGDPAGWIVFEPNGKTALYINQLFLKEKYRNTGLFVPLLTFAYQQIPKTVKHFFFYVNGDNVKMLGLMRLFANCHIKRNIMVEMTRSV